MRFALSPDQEAFRDAVADLLGKACPPSVVRAAWDAPAGALDRGVWEDLAGMGVLSVLVPEAEGGLGLDETFLVPVLEACGQAALPHPVVETAMVAAPLLGAEAGMVSTDLGGPNLPCAADADVLLLRDGDRLVRATSDEVVLEPLDTVDRARRAARVRGPGDEVGGDPEAVVSGDQVSRSSGGQLVTDDPDAVDLAFDRGALGTAAGLVGLAQAMLDQTIAYVTDRHQFGVPVGSFQAVKHHCANVALALEHTRPVVWRAAWSVAHDLPTRARDVSAAKAMANQAAERAGRTALQCHGAIGYTVEADLHLFLKRSWALIRAWGDTAFHTDRVADALMP
ncbi:MAG: acyl-CoA dehydrogenase family protein [Actinomycetota bacterium]